MAICTLCIALFLVVVSIISVSGFNGRGWRRLSSQSSPSQLRASYNVNIISKVDGKTIENTVKMDDSVTILDALRSQGIDAPYSCQAGLCTECAVLILSNQESGIELEAAVTDPETTAKGYVLSCSARVVGEGVNLILGLGEEMYEDAYGDFRRDHESYQQGGANDGKKGGIADGILNLNVEA